MKYQRNLIVKKIVIFKLLDNMGKDCQYNDNVHIHLEYIWQVTLKLDNSWTVCFWSGLKHRPLENWVCEVYAKYKWIKQSELFF